MSYDAASMGGTNEIDSWDDRTCKSDGKRRTESIFPGSPYPERGESCTGDVDSKYGCRRGNSRVAYAHLRCLDFLG